MKEKFTAQQFASDYSKNLLFAGIFGLAWEGAGLLQEAAQGGLLRILADEEGSMARLGILLQAAPKAARVCGRTARSSHREIRDFTKHT